MKADSLPSVSRRTRRLLICSSLSAFVVVLLLGCSKDLANLLDRDAIWTVSTYSDGRQLSTKEIGRDSSFRKFVLEWIKKNETAPAWSHSIVTYVPVVLISGKSFQLNFRPEIAVVGVESKWQLTRNLSPEEYSRVVAALSGEK